MSSSYGDFNNALVKDLRANGGRASSGPFKGRDVLILTTKGAKSGDTRVNPVAFSRDDGKLVIVASKGGAPTNPAWYHNLLAHPEVTLEVLGDRFKARAWVADDADYERLYANHAGIHAGFNDYRKRTTRKIPVVVLERIV